MSWFPSFPLSSAPTASSTKRDTEDNSDKPPDLMSEEESPPEIYRNVVVPSPLNAHHDARAIVQLLQCHFCSLPLQQPVLLPCGNGICRKCLPKSYKRENITYPSLPNRLEGFTCPFEECRQEHALEDSSSDVTLNKVMERINIETVRYRMSAGDTPTQIQEKLHWRHTVGGSDGNKKKAHTRVLHGGRLLSAFTMAELGELRYDSDLTFSNLSGTKDDFVSLDQAFMSLLQEITLSELECQVCWGLMLDPLTATCGHSFCRRCVARLLDHSTSCPVCRKVMSVRPGATEEPTNQRLNDLLNALVPAAVFARAQTVEMEEGLDSASGRIPLFICGLSFPEIPTFLHVFEPRYRLMIRRAMASDRRFGMVAYNARGEAQGDLGLTQFMQYGTLLHIESMQLLPDGRSVIQTRGVSRFRILDHDLLDDYHVGRVERIDDIPIAAEELLESSDISSFTGQPDLSASNRPISSMSTVDLMTFCTDFIERMHGVSATWLASNVLQAYGTMPNDPAVFPYWFASVLPINEAEKYRLLPTTSVRERLKITAGWVRKVQEILAAIPHAFGGTAGQSTSHSRDDSEGDDDDDDDDDDDNDSNESDDSREQDEPIFSSQETGTDNEDPSDEPEDDTMTTTTTTTTTTETQH